MTKLTIFKAAIAFFLAFIPPVLAGLETASTTRAWVGLFLAGFVSGLTALRSFVDKSFASDPQANPNGTPPSA